MNAAELLRQAETQLPAGRGELFRPYRWRDPARVTPERLAELAAIDAAAGLCSGCGNVPWFCACPAG